MRVKEETWDRQYRSGDKEREERGYAREDTHWIAPDEKSRVAVAPKGLDHGDDPVALALYNNWDMGQGSRDALAALGPKAFDMPPEAMEAWRKGELHAGITDEIGMVQTESQLGLLRDRAARIDAPERAWWDPTGAFARKGADAAADRFGAAASGARTMSDAARTQPGGPDYLAQMADAQDPNRKVMRDLYSEAMGSEWIKSGAPLFGKGNAGDKMLDKLDQVRDVVDFAALTPAERRLMVVGDALDAVKSERNPFEAMRLALVIHDEKERNATTLEMFKAIQRQYGGGPSALIKYVEWTQDACAESGVDPQSVLSGVKVRPKDTSVDSKVEELSKLDASKPETQKALADDLLGPVSKEADMRREGFGMMRGMGDIHDKSDLEKSESQRRAAEPTDWLRAMTQQGGPDLVGKAVQAAQAKDPAYLDNLWKHVKDDPARAAMVRQSLVGTVYERSLPFAKS